MMGRVMDFRPWTAAGIVRPGRLADWEPGEWLTGAVCAQTDPEVFYPEKGQNGDPAKGVCAVCPVKAQCLAYAVVVDDRHGVWGGMTTKQRDQLTSLAVPGMPEVVVALDKRTNGQQTGVFDAEVARLTAAGKSAAQIAEELDRDARTVVAARKRNRQREAKAAQDAARLAAEAA